MGVAVTLVVDHVGVVLDVGVVPGTVVKGGVTQAANTPTRSKARLRLKTRFFKRIILFLLYALVWLLEICGLPSFAGRFFSGKAPSHQKTPLKRAATSKPYDHMCDPLHISERMPQLDVAYHIFGS